jgi:hypothetical protein
MKAKIKKKMKGRKGRKRSTQDIAQESISLLQGEEVARMHGLQILTHSCLGVGSVAKERKREKNCPFFFHNKPAEKRRECPTL